MLCLPGRVGHPLTVGLYTFRNTGRSAAVVTKVELAHPRGLRTTNPVIVPITSTDEIGNWTSYPPRQHRRPAVGTGLTPGKTRWNLVFGLKPTTMPYGRSDGVDLYYTEHGQQYHLGGENGSGAVWPRWSPGPVPPRQDAASRWPQIGPARNLV